MSINKEGFRNSDNLTNWVRYMLYIQIVVAAVSIVTGYLEYKFLSDIQYGIYVSHEKAMADGEASDQRQAIVAIAYIVVFIILGFLSLRWIHRANYNARQLGAENMKFSSGWSIGYYFVPIMTFWKPYQAMKEIWKASKNPLDWKSQDASGILPIWWTLWIISTILGQAIFRSSIKAEELQELLTLNIVTQVSNFLDIPLALVFLSMVNSIHGMQTSHLANADNTGEP